MRISRLVSLATIACVAALATSSAAFAQTAGFGTAAEAKAMLEKTVVAMKADPAKTIAQINKGEGGFRDKDLYPFCAGPEGKTVAHPDPARIGLVLRNNKDVTGKAYGAEFYAVAAEGKFAEVSYMYPRPGPTRLRFRSRLSSPRWATISALSVITLIRTEVVISSSSLA